MFKRKLSINRFFRAEDGAAMVIAALSLIAFLSLASLVTDMGLKYYQKSRLQSAMDAAALAAVKHMPDKNKAKIVALEYVEKNGFSVDWFDNGLDGQEALFTVPYAAVILDLGLPKVDGLTILKHWREKNRKEPVLILTAQGDVDSKVIGLNEGADDYLGKPFSLKEVVARINALLRRNGGYSSAQLTYKDVIFSIDTKKVTKNGVLVELAPREIALLEMFLLNKNRVLTKTAVEEKLYSWDDDVQSNAVEVHVHHLRKKLGKDIVKTINKIGYIMEE